MACALRTVVATALFALLGCDTLNPTDAGSDQGVTDDLVLFSAAPDVGACVPGALTPEYQARVVRRINQLRRHHELPDVVISKDELAAAQEVALVAVANAKLTHSLPANAFCNSPEATKSSAESLLFLSAGNQVGNVRDPDRFLGDWLRDVDVPSLGHRRWLLDPFVSEVAFGFVQGKPKVDFPYQPVVGAALHVVDEKDVDLTWWASDFVAYPFGLYPAAFVDKSWLLSFSVVADRSQRLGSVDRVSFAKAEVKVTDEAGTAHAVADLRGAYDLTGVPNALSWRTEGLTNGVKYVVNVTGVTVDEQARDFEYWFLLMP